MMINQKIFKIIEKFAPLKYRSYLLYLLYRNTKDVEPEMLYLRKIMNRSRVAIDIGANIGYWSYEFAKYFDKVYAFEINPQLTRSLKKFNSEKIVIHNIGISKHQNIEKLYIPISNGVTMHGWASIENRKLAFADSFAEYNFPVTTLDSFKYTCVDFIKIDVEGHEVSVIEGAINTIKSNHPVLVIETEGENLELIRNILNSLNYSEVFLDALIGIRGASQNHIFVSSSVM